MLLFFSLLEILSSLNVFHSPPQYFIHQTPEQIFGNTQTISLDIGFCAVLVFSLLTGQTNS